MWHEIGIDNIIFRQKKGGGGLSKSAAAYYKYNSFILWVKKDHYVTIQLMF